MVVLVVGLLALVTMLDTSVKASMTTRAREGATNLARQIVEDARTIPYAQIVPESIDSQLQTIKAEGKYPLADSSSASGWQIERRGITYTLAVKECAIDNPKDGLATTKTHEEAKTFCEGQENWKEGTVDTEPEDLKRITVETSWTIQKHTTTVKQVSTLTAAGQAIGLIAKELQLVPPPTPFEGSGVTAPVITTSVTQLTFSVSFPEGTTAVDWSLEGATQKEITGLSKATSTTFSWTISGVSDGTYQVSAQAVNSTGVIGPPISIPVRLIRGAPKEPSGIKGGFKKVNKEGVPTEVVELQWKANSERDVIGYRVRNPSGKAVCPEPKPEEPEGTLSTATSCIDFKPSEGSYKVAALYRIANEKVEESAPGEIMIKRPESAAPNPPTGLGATKNPDGTVTLTWTAPSGAAPSFYRIYRGSTNYTSRYSETTETTFKDTDATEAHKYWVTAVSSELVESTFSNEASG